VELLIPDLEEPSVFVDLLQREGWSCTPTLLHLPQFSHAEDFLKKLFLTSDATLIDEGSLGTTSPEWVYLSTISIPCASISFRVAPR
jgi:isoleucyl-tRNA synthetase